MKQGLGIFKTFFATLAVIFPTIIHMSLPCISIDKAKLQISHYVCLRFFLRATSGWLFYSVIWSLVLLFHNGRNLTLT